MKTNLPTGLKAGIIACHHCGFVSRLDLNGSGLNNSDLAGFGNNNKTKNNDNKTIICPRCHAELHTRIPNSLAKTTALLFAAAFMYIPANILPIMNTTYLGTGQSDTIMQGVLHLIEEGMWPLALIVFVASIVVPLLKLLVMAGLILSVKLRSHWRPAQRTRLFHITEFVGRWSMVDIFVLALLVALVQFGNLASVDAGLGALSFAMVVILTMLAAHSFDPRLIWDAIDEADEADKADRSVNATSQTVNTKNKPREQTGQRDNQQ